MSTDIPIACSLSPAELSGRLEEISAVGRDALISVGPDNALRFRPDPGIRARLDAIVAAEARCCSFLSFDLREDAGDLVLTIAAPADAEPLATELADTFAAEASAA